MSSYPKWLYHQAKAPVIVDNEAEQKALGSEWVESPALAKAKPTSEPPPAEKPPEQKLETRVEDKSAKKVK